MQNTTTPTGNTCACPHCGGSINPAAILGSIKSEKKAAACRANGLKGGRNNKSKAMKTVKAGF